MSTNKWFYLPRSLSWWVTWPANVSREQGLIKPPSCPAMCLYKLCDLVEGRVGSVGNTGCWWFLLQQWNDGDNAFIHRPSGGGRATDIWLDCTKIKGSWRVTCLFYYWVTLGVCPMNQDQIIKWWHSVYNLQSRRTNLCIAVVFSILSHRAGNEMSLMFTPAQLRSHLFDRTDSLRSYIFLMMHWVPETRWQNTLTRVWRGSLVGCYWEHAADIFLRVSWEGWCYFVDSAVTVFGAFYSLETRGNSELRPVQRKQKHLWSSLTYRISFV